MKITVSKHQVENGGDMIFNCTFFFFFGVGSSNRNETTLHLLVLNQSFYDTLLVFTLKGQGVCCFQV